MLEPGNYKIRFEGEIGELTFTGGRVLENNSRFTVSSVKTGELNRGSLIGLWIGIVVVSSIVLATMFVLLVRFGKRKEKGYCDAPGIEREDKENDGSE